MRDFVIQNNAEISPPILETSWKPVNRKRHPEVRPPLRFGGGSGPGIEVLQTFALPLGHGVFCTM